MEPFLKKYYRDEVQKQLREKLGKKNIHEVPTISKVVINSGVKSTAEKTWMNEVQKDISALAGQHAVVTRAKKSIAQFKLREGMPIGVKCTLRGARMWDFLYRLIAVALPTIRDFRGVNKKLDGRGNYTIGITDHSIFPEISADTGGRETIGMDITIVTTAETDEEAIELLSQLGMPFRKTAKEQAAEKKEGEPAAASA